MDHRITTNFQVFRHLEAAMSLMPGHDLNVNKWKNWGFKVVNLSYVSINKYQRDGTLESWLRNGIEQISR